MVQSTRLAVVPGWLGELTRLEALEVGGMQDLARLGVHSLPKSLPASLGQLGALKQLTLAKLWCCDVATTPVRRPPLFRERTARAGAVDALLSSQCAILPPAHRAAPRAASGRAGGTGRCLGQTDGAGQLDDCMVWQAQGTAEANRRAGIAEGAHASGVE